MSQLDYSQFTPVEIDGLKPNNIYLIKTPGRDEIVKYINNNEKYNFYLLHFGNLGNNNKWTDKSGNNNTIKYTKSDLIKHPIYDLEDYKDSIENGDIKSIKELMYDNSRFDAAHASHSNVAAIADEVTAIADEVTARESAIADEVTARESAIAAAAVAFRLSNSNASGSGTSATSSNYFNIGDLKEYGTHKKKTSNSNRLSNFYHISSNASGSGTSAASSNYFNIGDLKEYGTHKKKTSNSNRLSNLYHFSNSKSGSKSGSNVSKGGRKKSLKRSSKKMKKSKKTFKK